MSRVMIWIIVHVCLKLVSGMQLVLIVDVVVWPGFPTRIINYLLIEDTLLHQVHIDHFLGDGTA